MIRRRHFLASTAAASLSLPFLRVLNSGASEPAFPRRLIIVCTPNGTLYHRFWPGASCAFGPILKPLEPFKNKLLVLRGLNMESAYKDPIPGDHGPDFSNLLTARQLFGGPSIDQYIAQRIGGETKFPSLQLGVQVGHASGYYPAHVSARGREELLPPEVDPYKVRDRLFQDFVAKPDVLERLYRERRSVLDLIRHELQDLQCQLGRDERSKFEAHLESVRQLEQSFNKQGGGQACQPLELNNRMDIWANDNFPALVRMQMDLAAMAVACDLTRVITLMIPNGGSTHRHTWLNIPHSHHHIAHAEIEGMSDTQRDTWLTQIETWYAEQFAYLCGKLDAIPEGDGTMLDNTALVWAHEQSDGFNHNRRDMPFVIAGSCGGSLRGGRCLDFRGQPHNGLLISIANAMGVPTERFGDPDYSRGPLSELA